MRLLCKAAESGGERGDQTVMMQPPPRTSRSRESRLCIFQASSPTRLHGSPTHLPLISEIPDAAARSRIKHLPSGRLLFPFPLSLAEHMTSDSASPFLFLPIAPNWAPGDPLASCGLAGDGLGLPVRQGCIADPSRGGGG